MMRLLSSERVLTALVHAFISSLLTVLATLLEYQINGREEEERAGEDGRRKPGGAEGIGDVAE